MPTSNNSENIAQFHQFLSALLPQMQRSYDRNINKDLSQQNSQELFKRNVSLVIKTSFDEATDKLASLSFDTPTEEQQKPFSNITEQALKPFDKLIENFLYYTLNKHRTSCALSNFEDERSPSQNYINEVLEIIKSDWNHFTETANNIILGRR